MNDPKYVNSADVNGARRAASLAPADGYDPASVELIELLFFAYRDFVSAPDEVLARQSFGRAHHRVLHFVTRNPGLSVAELLDILKITKQSLARVLRELIAKGHVEQRETQRDRRKRLLFATPKGRALALELAGLQSRRINGALAAMAPEGREAARAFLYAMIEAADRPTVRRLVGAGGAAP
jgi:DNA-binding MarR family transcriptional regulator